MSEVVESAIQQIKPLRGRRPLELKGGVLLSEARAAAKDRVSTARNAAKFLKRDLATATKELKSAEKRLKSAEAVVAKVIVQRFASIVDKKTATTEAKTELAQAKDAAKISAAAAKKIDKELAGMQSELAKAELAKVKIEDQYRQSKVN